MASLTPEQKAEIRQICQQEFASFIASDRYTFQKHIQIFNGRNVILSTDVGTKFGTEASQKLAFFGETPVVQPNDTGNTSVASSGSGSAVKVDTRFNGGLGGTAYTITDLTLALKQLGLIE